MPILLDTNVYLLALRSENGAAFFANRFLPLVFQTYLAGVVIEDLYAGALDGEEVSCEKTPEVPTLSLVLPSCSRIQLATHDVTASSSCS